MIKCRFAERDDRDVIVAFNRAMAAETEHMKLRKDILTAGVRRVFDAPEKGFYLLAEIDGQPAAQLMVTREWSDWRNADFWWIQSVYVNPDFRRKGIYRSLHAEVVRLAERNGNVCGIRLYVDKTNTVAQTAYLKLGMNKSRYVMMEQDIYLTGA